MRTGSKLEFYLGGGKSGFQQWSAGAGLGPSGVAVAPKVASAPRGAVARHPCGPPASIPPAATSPKKRPNAKWITPTL